MKLKTFFAFLFVVALLVGGQQANAQYPGMSGGYPPMAGSYQPMPYPGAPYGVAPALMQAPMASLMAPPTLDATPASFEAISDAAACDGKGCDSKGCTSCCNCGYCFKVGAFGEFLYLQARDAEVAYAVPVNGPIVPPVVATPIEIGRVGVVDQDYDPGFRIGFTFSHDPYSSLTAQYTYFDTERTDISGTAAPFVLRSLVSHPSTLTAGADYLDATARHRIAYDLIDFDFRSIISCCDLYQTNWLLGVRYAQLQQQFRSEFTGNGTENVDTNISYYSLGLRAGIEGERYTCSRRWLAYGKLHGSLMAGEFRADYEQRMSFDPVVASTSWRAGRIMPIVDLEVGAGWQSRCGTWRVTGGYIFSGWFNTVKTDEWIQRVQRGSFLDLGDTMTFDGLVGRVEARF